VLKVEEWIRIRELSRKGVTVSEIARQTGRDRKTVRKVLEEATPKLERLVTKSQESKLAPFREYLLQRIDQGCLNGTVLLEEITKLGYSGKISILRGLLTPIRKALVRKREATERFETNPGKQAQVDWAEFGKVWVPDESRWRKLYLFLFTLGYSRAQYLEFTTSCDMEHFLSCHLGAFAALGIPEEVLYDNLKTGILGRRIDGTAILPGRFGDFALYYGFTPRFCRPYRARTKGKIERGVGYARQNFWVRVQTEVAAKELYLSGLNLRAREWSEGVANLRVHGTHGEVVLKRFLEEEPLLGKLDARPRFDTDYHAIRRVGRDGRLSYRGQLYQVPLKHALSQVEVAANLDGQVTIRARSDQKTDHTADPKSGGEVLRSELILAGKVASLQVVQGPEKEPESRQGRQESVGELLRVVYLDEPLVETRDLRVYEEVALAASVG
jgi:transposase